MNLPWYQREDTKEHLAVFGRALQGPSPYQVILEPDAFKCRSGCCSFDRREITVNPVLFSVLEKEQYLLTKALLVHEAGHKRYTTPSTLASPVREITNILEDERVERMMWHEFAGVRWLIKKLADQFYMEAHHINPSSNLPDEVISYFLQLRWAERIGQPVNGELSAKNKALWQRVEPLVYESWQAESSVIVNRNAAKIADILGLSHRKSANQNITDRKENNET